MRWPTLAATVLGRSEVAGRICPQPPPTLTLAAESQCGKDSAGGLASRGGQAPPPPGRGFRDGRGPKLRLSSLPNAWSQEDVLETDWILGGQQGGGSTWTEEREASKRGLH